MLVDAIIWLWQERGNISFLAVVGFLAKQSIPILSKRLRLDEAWDRLIWLTNHVEQMTGDHYIPPGERYTKKARKNLLRWFILLRAVVLRAYRLRRRKSMIDKKWLLSLFVFLASFIKTQTGFEIPVELLDMVVNWLWLGGVVGMAVFNMVKKYQDSRKHPFDGGVTNAQPTIGDHGPMV